jgi:iron complex transport system permease protein
MRRIPFFIISSLFVTIAMTAYLFIGSIHISPKSLLDALKNPESGSRILNIVFEYHLTKGITALLAGAALGVTGLYGQTLFRNPMADAQVLGITSGAGFGAAVVMLTAGKIGSLLLRGAGMTAGAVAGGLLMALILLPLVRRRGFSMTSVLLTGLMAGQLAGAGILLLVHFGDPERIKGYLGWSFGSFSGVTRRELPLLAGTVLPVLALSLLPTRRLNALAAGEDFALSVGVRPDRIYRFGILAMALLTGAVTAFCGPVGFIGLAVPHLCRFLLKSSDHRVLLPAVMLTGALTALIAGLVSVLPGGGTVLPVNAITSLVGAPVILWFVLRHREYRT